MGCGQSLVVAANGEIWNYQSLREQLEADGHVFRTESDSEVLVHRLEDEMLKVGDLSRAVEAAISELDGEYAFAAYDGVQDEFVLARDVVGVKQLYYGETDEHLAFCSEKKPLWDLSIKPQRVLPGQAVKLACDPTNGWLFSTGSRVELSRPNRQDETDEEHEALEAYRKALVDAVRKRVVGHRQVGIIFSGGVDSVLVARIAQRLGVDVRCYASGLPDSSDVDAARSAADALALPLAVSELGPRTIESELPSILRAIESANHLQVDVAIPIYFAVKRAAEDGIRVMLTGQGADELFAGYPWYPEIVAASGAQTLRESLWNDLSNLYKDTLEREDKITMFHSIELRVPYLDPRVIGTAMRIAPALKIRDGELKYLHRKLAEQVGVPGTVAWRAKEAAQHGSNVHETLKGVLARLEEAHGAGSHDEQPKPDDATEELGSAYRYGGDAYAGNERHQKVLDSLGREMGLA
jgi:asparagine synthase (glutamine-hydrolysing)